MTGDSAQPLVSETAWRAYTGVLAGERRLPWWTAVVLTASSERQAHAYEAELAQRRARGALPAGVPFLVVPDPKGPRLGSGGATVHALAALARHLRAPVRQSRWWRTQRVLLLHSGGESQRLPQYSPSGKVFTPLPVAGPGGGPSTVFDETLALSTLWVERLPAGLVAGSGDVLLVFDPRRLDWESAGVSGVGLRCPPEVGAAHGVYVPAPDGRVLSFLQKPSVAESLGAGAVDAEGRVAVDTGLVRFSPDAAARLGRLFASGTVEPFDLYYHLPRLLTGELAPPESAGPALRPLLRHFRGQPFRCDVVDGTFTHIGTTALFRHVLTGAGGDSAGVSDSRQRLGLVAPAGVRSDGVILDSVVAAGSVVGPRAVVLESVLDGPVEVGAGAMVHGLHCVGAAPWSAPPDVVLHQVPVRLEDGRVGTVIRVFGVGDNPKSHPAEWLGLPAGGMLAALGLAEDEVWPGVAADQRTLWNAALFPVTTPPEALGFARWFLGQPVAMRAPARRWRRLPRLSLAGSAAMTDEAAADSARAERARRHWESAAVELARDGADVRPLLAQSPGIASLAHVARTLVEAPEAGPSLSWVASLYFAQAGMAAEAENARAAAWDAIQRRVAAPPGAGLFPRIEGWRHETASATAPARIDFGGGWSDTPPFCLDWGGTVLNAAIQLDGANPIAVRLTRLNEPHIEVCPGGLPPLVIRSGRALFAPAAPGDPYALARTALRLTGAFAARRPLAGTLRALGGGLRIETGVRLPIGSGLGASSILAATLLRALAVFSGATLSRDTLITLVLELEQRMSTGGGWQDQAGAIDPGVKLLTSSPGAPQRVRCQPLDWTPSRRAECERLLVLAPTGIVRVARGLLQQVVGRYLARETAAVQVLHSIKTLALEMAHALREGEWDHLGALLDRHWALNQLLDPHTTNPVIEQILDSARPLVRGAKLAGAGGGGYLLLLARDEEAARTLRARFAAPRLRIATRGLRGG